MVKLSEVVQVIQALDEAAFGRLSSFSLAPCGICGGPTFQYPCPNCHSWNDYNTPKSVKDMEIQAAKQSGVGGKESFTKRVEAAGGIGPWYFSSFRNVVAYKPHSTFQQKVDELIQEASKLEWPSPGEVWDAVQRDGKLLNPEPFAAKIERLTQRFLHSFEDHRLPNGILWLSDTPEGNAVVTDEASQVLLEKGVRDIQEPEETPGLRM